MAKGGPVANIPVETGLLVQNNDVTNLLKENLKGFNTKTFMLGATKVFVYGPGDGFAPKDQTLDAGPETQSGASWAKNPLR